MFKFKKNFDNSSKDGNKSREDTSEKRLQTALDDDKVDSKFGFERAKDVTPRVGWLLNFHPTEILDEDKRLIAAIDYYFLQEDGSRFKTSLPFKPYFFILPEEGTLQEISVFLTKKFAGVLNSVEIVVKEDLDLPNHLSGLKRKYLKLLFLTVNDLNKVKKELITAVRRNKERAQTQTAYTELLTAHMTGSETSGATIASKNHLDNVIDIREYDVPYHVRAGIDNHIFIGKWYTVINRGGGSEPPTIDLRADIIEWPECIVLAFDIETTKLPLKFPDSKIDQIMMISYMIDGQGYLITNREIISQDIEDFEYTPKPEFQGPFIIFNEPNEEATIQRFFDHIIEVKPHIFVTYNGDFFDWPFVEARASHHGLSMYDEIGFAKNTEDTYLSRASVHMDCLCWVRRDSYLPVGSQGLKAVAKAKLRYDPVELNPEDMCRMACEEPQVLSNYSVSDAVATYYLYMKYVHPFIFALCTILPMDPDEVLRKGSGTLCEALLMVEAFKANVVFPNKQVTSHNRITDDGHVLDTETYVGGHVEAIESGIFRADIPCRFRTEPDAFQRLIDTTDATLRFAIEVEEKVPMDQVTNYDEVLTDVISKLTDLRNNPNRLENPVIYHLDVGAMYPNIILTNRLQPSAIVDEVTCAACQFNRPAARCRRTMPWMWRAEVMPAKRSELQHIRQQLEMERFPPSMPGGKERAFHQLSRDEQAEFEKKRLTDYCRRAYKKVHVTRMEERATTICQRENSFYVDTVRAFRDRRYEYKALNKNAKKQLSEAQASGDTGEVRVWNSRVILYDSLQLAHKCILNSFYGYVMRKGARWHSMQMAGIVCYTGASLITRAREIIEQIGRPLELDTDGIWCILPGSFPENYVIKTTNPKKAKITISYPNAVLNVMVKDHFTNDQYHDLTDPVNLRYSVRSENSIFFEVDGPYLAMVLPASKEEGKKLKKRYAVFNFDGSLAELKGFEVKRRGELQLIKIFQSSVFEAFLKGATLEQTYASVAKIADYWLDVLYSKGANMPDSELFELISENRSMSKTLAEYGNQKSTSIATARRLAEFLGDQIVKDSGLSCQYIISRKPEGAPVTERAIPLAIFHAEPSVRKHYLRRWLKDSSLCDFDLRHILDWSYYVERLGGCVQKIVTIPAALQGVSNPVPRVQHPDWLHKRLLEKNDSLKQRKIFDMFKAGKSERSNNSTNDSVSANDNNNNNTGSGDIEDLLSGPPGGATTGSRVNMGPRPVVTKRPRPRSGSSSPEPGGRGRSSRSKQDDDGATIIGKSWRQFLGDPPDIGPDKAAMLKWLEFHKRKWHYMLRQRAERVKRARLADGDEPLLANMAQPVATKSSAGLSSMSAFMRRTKNSLLDSNWQIVQIYETNNSGLFRMWCMVGDQLHMLKLIVPRIFYVNQRTAKTSESGDYWRRCVKQLPRSHRTHNLYEYAVPEDIYREHSNELMANLSSPDIEGIYETGTPSLYRIICQLGCVCRVDPRCHRQLSSASSAGEQAPDTFQLNQLTFVPINQTPYLTGASTSAPGTRTSGFGYRYIYLYMYRSGVRAVVGVCMPAAGRITVLVLNNERSNQLPNLRNLYAAERQSRLSASADSESSQQQQQLPEDQLVPPADMAFHTTMEVSEAALMRAITRQLQEYRDEKPGPTFAVVQSYLSLSSLYTSLPELGKFPLVPLHVHSSDQLFQTLDWQRAGARALLQQFVAVPATLHQMVQQSRYFHCPIGNIPSDLPLFGDDLFFGRHLRKNNYVLWASSSERPDLGGKEADDQRLLLEGVTAGSAEVNCPGAYDTVCIEVELDGLAATAILQSHHINEVEGVSSYVAFDSAPQVSLEDMLTGETPQMPSYDDSVLSYSSFKVLRTMVQSLLLDVTHYQNQLADEQLIHLYRWITSPVSLLYDPALKNILHMLMKKLFLQLLSELKRLGATIVFASFTKLVISSKKRTVDDALSYADYILDTIRAKDLFHSIDLRVAHCWRYLLWQDQVNFGGIKGVLVRSQEDSQETADTPDLTQPDPNEVSVEMSWNMCNFLPEAGSCQVNFNTIIASYISAVFQHVQSEIDSLTPIGVVVQRNTSSQPLVNFEDSVEFAKKLVSGEMAQKLFMITEKIHKKLPRTLNGETSRLFPVLPGSHLSLDNPALEFVKAICKVLSLDTRLESELTKLRRDLLRLIGVGEFSREADWRDPCHSHVLCDVICSACSHCCDLDLCRSFTQQQDTLLWCCPLCQTPYDKDHIQMALLSDLRKLLVSYVLQDLQCSKCRQVKQLNMSEICECAGRYSGMMARAQCLQRLHVLYRVATSFQLQLLKQQVEWTLEQCAD